MTWRLNILDKGRLLSVQIAEWYDRKIYATLKVHASFSILVTLAINSTVPVQLLGPSRSEPLKIHFWLTVPAAVLIQLSSLPRLPLLLLAWAAH